MLPTNREKIEVSENENEKISVTLKAGPAFSDPWIVVHADSPQEAATLLDAVALTGLGLRAASTARGFQAEYAASELGVTQVSNTVNGAASAQSVTQPAAQTAVNTALPHDGGGSASAVPTCHHGVKVYREAKPGSGKSWKGYFCPSPRGTADQCPPEFLKDR